MVTACLLQSTPDVDIAESAPLTTIDLSGQGLRFSFVDF
jgi:hypothetical protein